MNKSCKARFSSQFCVKDYHQVSLKGNHSGSSGPGPTKSPRKGL